MGGQWGHSALKCDGRRRPSPNTSSACLKSSCTKNRLTHLRGVSLRKHLLRLRMVRCGVSRCLQLGHIPCRTDPLLPRPVRLLDATLRTAELHARQALCNHKQCALKVCIVFKPHRPGNTWVTFGPRCFMHWIVAVMLCIA